MGLRKWFLDKARPIYLAEIKWMGQSHCQRCGGALVKAGYFEGARYNGFNGEKMPPTRIFMACRDLVRQYDDGPSMSPTTPRLSMGEHRLSSEARTWFIEGWLSPLHDMWLVEP